MDHWSTALPADLTFEQDGQQVPAAALPFVKETPDLPTLVRRAYDMHRRMGAAVVLPGKDAKPEDVQAFKTRVYSTGHFGEIPGTPEAYGIAKPADLPAGVPWSDASAGKMAGILHKYGVPKAAAAELLALHTESVMGATAISAATNDEALGKLKAEYGADYEARLASAKRLLPAIFTTPEEAALVERLGLGNHAPFLSLLMRLAPLAEADSSFLKNATQQGGALTAEQAQAEDKASRTDPKHPMHAAFLARDPKWSAWVDDLYKRAAGGTTAPTGRGGLQISTPLA